VRCHADQIVVVGCSQQALDLAARLLVDEGDAEHAARHGLWVPEDDYDSEYQYGGRPLTALHGLDRAGRVIYVGSFSKVLFPAVRVGYLVLPPDLVEPFVTARALALGHGSLIEQAVVAEFIAEGHFTRHLRRMRGLYAERQAALVEAAKRDLAGQFDVRRTQTGIHLVGWLSEGTDDRFIAQRAAAAGIIARPVSSFRIGPMGRPGLVLGFAAVRPPEIRDAMQRLATAFPSRAGARAQ